jgi:lipid-A-disaccharide synthase
LAIARQPDLIICIDFSGFNLRFAHAIRSHARCLLGTFGNWNPAIIQYVSPQVWASRPERSHRLAQDLDLVLSIFPFEKDWYAKRVPNLRVEFVGHPLIDRCASSATRSITSAVGPQPRHPPAVLLLPGSRVGELTRHLPVMLESLRRIRSAKPTCRAGLVLPNDALVRLARSFPLPSDLDVQCGGIAAALAQADLAIASTGTVTLECAYFGVPTVALYKTSWSSYWIGKQLIRVNFLAMPNILAGEEVFPEFIQHVATPENISRAALNLLDNPDRRATMRVKLARIVASLGETGASQRAAEAILDTIATKRTPIRAALRS